MKKRNKIFPFTLTGIIIFLIVVIGIIFTWKSFEDYSKTLKANWNIELPSDSHYFEIYSQDSGASFHGDGIRYHIFAYKENEPISKMFEWQSEEHKTNCYSSYSEAANEWLNEIDIPSEERPNYTNCLYWYQSQDDNSEIIILWDKKQDRLYLVESFL